jgi:hypothetical protein
MVDALREAQRVLTPRGSLIDVRPVTAPIVVEVVIAARAIWEKEVDAYSTPEDVAAADAAVQHALSGEWFAFEKSLPFDLEIYCDTAADLSLYAQARKLREAGIPYEELEERRCHIGADGQPARLRCRRPWMVSAYRKKRVLQSV